MDLLWLLPGPGPEHDGAREPIRGRSGAHLKWGWAWPANPPVMYNRASGRPEGQPLERTQALGVVGPGVREPPDPKTRSRYPRENGWAYDVPTSRRPRPQTAQPKPDGIGLDALSGTQPFIMRADGGAGCSYRRVWWTDASDPLRAARVTDPEHRCTSSRPARCTRSGRRASRTTSSPQWRPEVPYVISTYRLTEHYLAGAMSRWLAVARRAPAELFHSSSGTTLAKEKGSRTSIGCRVEPRGHIARRRWSPIASA